jgi:hypothetical protein
MWLEHAHWKEHVDTRKPRPRVKKGLEDIKQ